MLLHTFPSLYPCRIQDLCHNFHLPFCSHYLSLVKSCWGGQFPVSCPGPFHFPLVKGDLGAWHHFSPTCSFTLVSSTRRVNGSSCLHCQLPYHHDRHDLAINVTSMTAVASSTATTFRRIIKKRNNPPSKPNYPSVAPQTFYCLLSALKFTLKP